MFNEIEAIVGYWYFIADSDGRTEDESTLIKEVLMKKYHIWDVINWDGFIEKWNKLKKQDDFDNRFSNSCKESLQNADYSSKIIVLSGMWSIAVDADQNKENPWSKTESSIYLDLEAFLKIPRDEVKEELNSNKKTLLNALLQKYILLYKENKFSEVITYYETKIQHTKKYPVFCSAYYLWALFKSDGSEKKAYDLGKDLLSNNPDVSILIEILGYISQWLGKVNNDISKLEESIVLFNSLNKKEEVGKSKEKIQSIKNNLKEKEKAFKLEQQEREKLLKQEEKEKEKKLKLEEKEKEKEKKERQHKLKSSKGETFCIYCGMTEGETYTYKYCDGRLNGHNYVYMKDKKDRWHLKCNKCGAHSSDSRYRCS